MARELRRFIVMQFAVAFLLTALFSCDKNNDAPDNNPTITDTVAGNYRGRLIQSAYNGPTVTPDTVENQVFTVQKISGDSIQIDGFGEDGYEMYLLNDPDTSDGIAVFSGVGSGVLYGFNASFFVTKDSIHLEAQKHITTGTGIFWRFDGKKQ